VLCDTNIEQSALFNQIFIYIYIFGTAQDEIGGIKLLKAENKGKSNRRIYFELVDRP